MKASGSTYIAMCMGLLSIILACPVQAKISIQAKIDGVAQTNGQAIYPLAGQKVSLYVKQVPNSTIKWYQILPDISRIYKNANFPWDDPPYKWIGFDKIIYHREELTRFKNQWKISPVFSNRAFNSEYFHLDIGSFWVQAVVQKNNITYQTPGIESSDYRGLSPHVFRVSIRKNKGYLGYLTSFFNVPGLFGSIPYQSYHYIGADCADILMAAFARFKHKPLKKDYNVAMLVNSLPHVAQCRITNGMPSKKLIWEKHIRVGDLIAVRYAGQRQFGHIGVLVGDSNHNLQLDPSDTILHAGPYPLVYTQLNAGGFDGFVVILRLL